jgi:DNA-binding NarL/FixJ family response regulator
VTGALRVLIADDHEAYQHELREMLERNSGIEVVDVVSNGADAVRRVLALRPNRLDLVLMDINMPVMDGIQATREIAARDPSLPIVILTVSALDSDLFAGIGSGAIGFLNKNLSPMSLVRTLRDFRANGSLPMSRVMAGKVMAYLQQRQVEASADRTRVAEKLSSREQEVLRRIASGARDREIAATLFVAESTIKTHVRHILRKLGVRNRAEAVARIRGGDRG